MSKVRQRIFDLPQWVIQTLLGLPGDARIVRMAVVHDAREPGPPPLRVIVESEEYEYVHANTTMITVTPIWKPGAGFEFSGWWHGSVPPCDDYFGGMREDWL